MNPDLVNDAALQSPPSNADAGARDLKLTKWIFLVVCLVILWLGALLTLNLTFQYHNYRDAIAAAGSDEATIRHGATLSYARAWDFAVVKTASLFLAYVLIFTGALYVLGVGEATFAVRMKSEQAEASLRTSSPGLAMIALGVVLVGLAMYSRTEILTEFERSPEDLTDLPGATGGPAVQTGNVKPR